MALKVERVVDGGVHTEKALDGCSRFEPLHLALSPSHDLCEFSARLFIRSPCSWRQDRWRSRKAAP
jgi:hypothetical protein